MVFGAGFLISVPELLSNPWEAKKILNPVPTYCIRYVTKMVSSYLFLI